MGFYLRKGFSLGNFARFNLSRSGLGVSLGVKGARIGIDARGRSYVHAGRGGFYYRKHLSTGRPSSLESPRNQKMGNEPGPLPLDTMTDIVSADVSRMADASSKEILDELNRVQRRTQLFPLGLLVVLGFVAWIAYSGAAWWAYVLVAIPIVPVLLFLRHLDVTKGTVFLKYEMDEVAEENFKAFCKSFATFNCKRVWNLDAQGRISDWKRNAGASGQVKRSVVRPRVAVPPRVICNLEVPTLPAGRETLYFFPDRVLVFQAGKVGSIPLPDLSVNVSETRFIEEGGVPSDARVVDHTWRFVRKDGGPDRRFNNNYQIPVALYGEIELTSRSGLKESFHTSNALAPKILYEAVERQLRAGTSGIVIATLVGPDTPRDNGSGVYWTG